MNRVFSWRKLISPFGKGELRGISNLLFKKEVYTVSRFLLRQGALVFLLAVVALLAAPAAGGPVLAQDPQVKHENPETAELIYDPISLLRYYSETQDALLRRDVDSVTKRLEKIPFANVPANLQDTLNELNSHETELANLAVEVNEQLGKIGKLMGQFRLNEALEIADMTAEQIDRGYDAVDSIDDLVETVGQRTGAASASPGSQLRRAYAELSENIDKQKELFDTYKARLTDLVLGERTITLPKQQRLENLRKALGNLQPTKITLGIEPATAFVGDEVPFSGRLTTRGKPLAGRKIILLLDGTECDSAVTGKDGWYEGTFNVPYKYVPEVSIEALHRPRDEDVGVYLASKSPPVKLDVMFYQANLLLNLDDKAYPGLETTISGRFDYGESPVLETREIEVYFDDRLITRQSVSQEFSVPVKINPDNGLGKHRVTVSASADGRYAPVVASSYLEIVRIKPVVDLNLPTVAFVPGSLDLTGKAYSEVGPITNGEIKLKFGDVEAVTRTSQDGTFLAELSRGMGLELIGSQSINVKVIPDEAWHAQVSSSRSLFVVNWFDSGGIIIVLVVLGFVVRRRLRGFTLPGRGKSKESRSPVPLPATPKPSGAMYTSGEEMPKGDPRKLIVGWYQRVVRLLVAVLGLGFGPSHTLREFLREATPRLGPIAGLFEELTRFVERILYAGHRPTDTEARRAEEISRDVEERVKGSGG